MYARVASFEGRDASLTDDLIQRAREVGPGSVPEAKGFLGLFDRDAGKALSITFFESEEDIRNSEQAFEDMAQNFPSEMRGRRTSVDVYEVSILDGDLERGKAARVNRFESVEDVEDTLTKTREETLPKIRQVAGNVGLLGLLDRNSRRMVGITFWESDDALRQSEEQAQRLREETGSVAAVENYDVAIAQNLSGVRA